MIPPDCKSGNSGYNDDDDDDADDDNDGDDNNYGCTSRYPWEMRMAEDRMAGGFVTV